jgi:medium-chain acyl-[acyl-carrier-protein] hydrolase
MKLALDSAVLDLRNHLEMPTVFFGHSMGAMLCFEVARRLRKEGLGQPLSLLVSACHAPQNPAKSEPMSGLPDRELMQRLHCMEGTPPEILEDEDFINQYVPVLRADLHMADHYQYRPEPPLDLPITAFGGREDREVQAEELQSWQLQTSKTFQLQMFAGGHFYLRTSEKEFLPALSEMLEQAAAVLPAPITSDSHAVNPLHAMQAAAGQTGPGRKHGRPTYLHGEIKNGCRNRTINFPGAGAVRRFNGTHIEGVTSVSDA